MSKDIIRGEIRMEGDERIASMCPLPGLPGAYMVMTTRAVMWKVATTSEGGWTAQWIASKSDNNAPHDSGML